MDDLMKKITEALAEFNASEASRGDLEKIILQDVDDFCKSTKLPAIHAIPCVGIAFARICAEVSHADFKGDRTAIEMQWKITLSALNSQFLAEVARIKAEQGK